MKITHENEELDFYIESDLSSNTVFILSGKKGIITIEDWVYNNEHSFSIVYHAKNKQYENQNSKENCIYMGCPCFYDGRNINYKFEPVVKDKHIKDNKFDILQFMIDEYKYLK